MSEEPKPLPSVELARSYRAVFGIDGNRTVEQQVVMDDLSKASAEDEGCFINDGSGHCDPYLAAKRDGAQIAFLRIRRLLRRSETNKQKPKVVR